MKKTDFISGQEQGKKWPDIIILISKMLLSEGFTANYSLTPCPHNCSGAGKCVAGKRLLHHAAESIIHFVHLFFSRWFVLQLLSPYNQTLVQKSDNFFLLNFSLNLTDISDTVHYLCSFDL